MALIGTAGWSIPARYKSQFSADGSQLERYAARLKAVEINSSFYRPHQHTTYARWAAAVPADFRFAVKVPRSMTQEKRLQSCDDLLVRFGSEVSGLGQKLGVLLVQLPPSLGFSPDIAAAFFTALRDIHPAIACEPRHASWFTPSAGALLQEWQVVRVAADPPRASADGVPGGWRGFAYWRLHGRPKIYYSDYSDAALKTLAPKLGVADWCIFDNTAAFAAMGNALALNRISYRLPGAAGALP